MKKQFKVAGLAAAAVLSTAALAGAAEVNIFGASAQFDFWTAEATAYLGSANIKCGTIGTAKTFQTTTVAGTTIKHGYVQGTGCTGSKAPAATIDLRWSGIASAE